MQKKFHFILCESSEVFDFYFYEQSTVDHKGKIITIRALEMSIPHSVYMSHIFSFTNYNNIVSMALLLIPLTRTSLSQHFFQRSLN
eukprot:gene7864-5491_t